MKRHNHLTYLSSISFEIKLWRWLATSSKCLCKWEFGMQREDSSHLTRQFRPVFTKWRDDSLKLLFLFTCFYNLQKASWCSPSSTTNFYVDNLLESFDSEKEAIEIGWPMFQLLKKGELRLLQWISSSCQFLQAFPSSDLCQPTLNLDHDDQPTERTLGVLYNSESDSFCFRIFWPDIATTKCKILSLVVTVYNLLFFCFQLFWSQSNDIWQIILSDVFRHGLGRSSWKLSSYQMAAMVWKANRCLISKNFSSSDYHSLLVWNAATCFLWCVKRRL